MLEVRGIAGRRGKIWGVVVLDEVVSVEMERVDIDLGCCGSRRIRAEDGPRA